MVAGEEAHAALRLCCVGLLRVRGQSRPVEPAGLCYQQISQALTADA